MKNTMKLVFCAWCLVHCAFSAFAVAGPLLVPDYNRDGVIDLSVEGAMASKGEPFTVWLNDDDDAAGAEADDGKGDTNTDLHDVPGGEGNDQDCADDKVNGRCDLLDFFPVLIDVNGVEGSGDYAWKLISKSVNVVLTQLQTGTAGDFHTKEVKAIDDETPLYMADVEQLAGDDGKEEVELPDGFLKEGRGVIIVEGAALGDEGLTLRGEKSGSDPVEVTLDLRVKNVEEMYGWMNLRKEGGGADVTAPRRADASGTARDDRHFVFVHGYNTNHEEARGNAAEFYKKLWQSGCDAQFTAVEWKGDQSQIKFDLLGVNFTPNYHVNVENAFAAARPFADACKKLPGEKILVAHSLGNVLVSSAIKDYGLDYTKYVMLNAAVPREAFDASAYDEAMVPENWLEKEVEKLGGGGDKGGDALTNHLDRTSRWYKNFADHKYDPYEYRRKLAWRGRFANLPRTVNYYSQSDNILVNPAPNEPDPDEVFDRNDPEIFRKVNELLEAKLVNGRSIGSGGSKKTGFGFWSFSEKMKGTWLLDTVNDVLTNMLEVAQADAYKREGGWGENDDYEEKDVFDPANTRFTPFLDERLKAQGMLDILPAETERVRAQHLADAIPAESFAAGANSVTTLENVNEEDFIGENLDWPLYEGEEIGEARTNVWNHSAFREVAFYHTSKLYASLAAVGKPRVIIDTDLGSSMDDLFAIDLAARMHKEGKLDLMAVMMDRPDKFNPEKDGEFLTFADRYLASLGLGDLPIGKAMMPADSQTSQYVFNPYWTLIYSNNLTGVGLLLPTNRTPDQIEQIPGAVALYRRLLNDAPDKSVVVCSTGFLTNLKGLMESEENEGGDDIWSTGLELIEQKVKELRIMGGWFDLTTEPADGARGAEYNFAGDPAAAKKVVEGWPTPVVLSPWEVGLKLDYKTPNVLEDFPPGTFDPVVRAAHIYWPEPLGDDDKNRLWDPATVLPLTEGEAFLPLSEMGGVSVDDYGKTTFIPDPSSNRCYQVAANMDERAVMNRIRAICRTGNPSLPDTVRCIKDAGVDYNGHDLTFKVPKFSLGTYGSNDVHMAFAFGDKSYEPDAVTYDPVLEVFSVHFTVPEEDATAGNVYNGELSITLENDVLGPNVVKTVSTQLVQGRQEQAEPMTDWFNETNLKAPTNYVPATAMPERCLAKVETTFLFEAPVEATDDPPEGVVQGAVRIVADGADGYKFQYFACVGKTNEDSFVRGWWDFNVGGEDAQEIKPVLDKEYTVRAEAYYFDDARGGENTLVISVEEEGSNQGFVKQFIGNIVNEKGGQGGTTRLNSVEFVGAGEISSLVGNYYTNVVNATLAKIDGDREYATVAAAVAAASGSPIRLLHAASWKPTAADIGTPVRFLNKSDLVLDLSGLPANARAVWSDVDGNNGTLTLSKVDPVGVCSWSWHEPMTNILARMEANGFKGIQLALSPWVWEGEGSAAQKETFGDQEGEEVFNLISNKFAKGELDIHATMICFSNEDYTTEHTISNTCGFYYGLAPSATEEQKALADLTWEIRSNQFAKAVERTAALGVRNITAHIGLVHLDDDMSRLYWACKTCQANGCKLLVETGMYSAQAEVFMLEQFKALHPDAEIGLNFDMANQVLYGADNPTNAYAVMKDWIAQVHVKDCVETYSARGDWATDVEWGRGDVSRTYDMIGVLKADGFTGPMLVEHESGSSDSDVREREILTAVKAIRGEPAPVVAGLGEVLGPYLTAVAATNAARGAEFTPSAEVAAVLDGDADAKAGYCAKFGFAVEPVSGGAWAVTAGLTPAGWTNVVLSAQAATRQIPVADIAALEMGAETNVTVKGCCEPGFYYSLFSGGAVTNLQALASEEGRNVLCAPDKQVEFSGVTKPFDAAGFFSVGVKETPDVQPSDRGIVVPGPVKIGPVR